ncbi:MAG: hypothetical protein UV74_C0013G0415 [Candidatus Woesebacteria bacterium GW2011_GWB1_43_14]|uniref:Uncharacterized protein n=1 Tax=Candidatus Woesebacteria bacterium GW2011_GWB1_43_14 TaxID=1618578 RepID=A0A0G1GEK1_9BACT|nr:MAG: hypothetical protein UT21_C0001G0127 [Candidatus Woesebacteria bacterium GW2011_GWA1_39_11b]KKS78287.1 MAG: hypothetical protein UV51_C0001G0003 [Candidatus Woesebacteria bacterium GW2011_GWC1_42_9]KKS97293.1 MAG: hypothetical protein UV74_C0013G0415 [Candidatus Woesebacteria bacterium GW2011_GWB1_43_14]
MFNNQKGTITPALLIITAAFVAAIYGILIILSLQINFSNRQVASEEALAIAEAGINYYSWHLSKAPTDYTSDTGIHTFIDPQGQEIGEFNLEITPPETGSAAVTIRSTGKTYDYPSITRTIKARYGEPALSQYTFFQNASSWYGPETVVYGDIFSNNGIRMDGTNYGRVMSAKETYKCGTETGCFPPDWRPGVWGSGGDQSLWTFPVSSIDFDSISLDFNEMKSGAINDGLYLENSDEFGYHLVFSADGSFSLYRVLATNYYNAYRVPGNGLGAEGAGGCRKRYEKITDEEYIGSHNTGDTPIIFAEDHLWIEGTVDGRVTIAAVGFPLASREMNIRIPNNLVYEQYDDSDSLGLVAQNDILISRDIPTDFRIDGALVAQKGAIMRFGYLSECGSDTANAIRNSMIVRGSLSSYFKATWNYGTDPLLSGFNSIELQYDSDLSGNPPVYFPTSGTPGILSWTEE